MLTIVIALLAGIFLAHVLESALKAAAIVAIFVGVIYLARGVSFEALVDEGAHELFDGSACRPHHTAGFRL